MTGRVFRCYVFGSGQSWEGLCVDLDIGAQGSSPKEVLDRLGDAIDCYIDAVMDLDSERDRERLLNRRSPLWLRAKLACGAWLCRHVPNFTGFVSGLLKQPPQVTATRVPCHA